MAEILVTLPDGSERSFERGATAKDVAGSIAKSLQKAGIAAKYNGELDGLVPQNVILKIKDK